MAIDGDDLTVKFKHSENTKPVSLICCRKTLEILTSFPDVKQVRLYKYLVHQVVILQKMIVLSWSDSSTLVTNDLVFGFH